MLVFCTDGDTWVVLYNLLAKLSRFLMRICVLIVVPLQLLVRSDRQLVVVLAAAVDSLITLLLILGVICFAITASIFLAVQVSTLLK